MIVYNFKIGFRNLRRQKGYASLNIVGLAIGIACCLFIGLFVRDELSFDEQYANAGRIFRVVTKVESRSGTNYYSGTPVPLGPALRQEFPEVRRAARFWQAAREVVRTEDKAFEEEGFYFADPDVLTMFGFPLISGDPKTALAHPNSVVITQSVALKYFGQADPVGRVITVDGYPVKTMPLQVTGVLKDLPENTQFAFRFLGSVTGIRTEIDNWGSTKPIWTYVELPSGAQAAELEAKLPAFVDRHLRPHYLNQTRSLHLEPLRRVHLYSRYTGGFKPRGDSSTVVLFGAIGLIILLVACMNFVNLSTALSFSRAREVGVRKVLGADRGGLIRYFLAEAFIVASSSVALSLVLLEIFLPAFNALAGKSISLNASNRGYIFFLAAAVLLGVGILADAYPAFSLSGYRPLAILRGRLASSGHGSLLRKALVVSQFTISTVLVIATAVISEQLTFIRHKNLGITTDQVLVVPYSPAAAAIRTALLQDPRIKDVAVSQRVPVNTENGDTRPLEVEGIPERQQVESYVVDTHFLDTYGLRLIAGEELTERFPEGETPFLINETAVRRFGWASPGQALGVRVRWSGTYKTGRIVGVVNDFNLTSMHEEISPLVLLPIPDDQWWRSFMSIRLRPEDLPGTISLIHETWLRLTPGGAYRSFFIDDSFEQLHREDERLGRVVSTFAGLSVFIACLGLFGLGTFAAKQRTKEIGIRKVLGALMPSIVGLLSGEFLKLVMMANLLAWPAAYLTMRRWLEAFAYRIDIGFGTFLIAGGSTLLIAFAAVAYQAVRAALTNPVEALRYE